MQFLTWFTVPFNFIIFIYFSICVYLYSTSRINKLGSGSDFEAYFQRLGIASGRARYTKNRVSHCIILDTQHDQLVRNFKKSTFLAPGHVAQEKNPRIRADFIPFVDGLGIWVILCIFPAGLFSEAVVNEVMPDT